MVDKIRITVTGGNGGDGLVGFRHEKYVPFGGPDGGDGGNGGSVYFMASPSVNDLSTLKQRKKFIAESGDQGGKQRKHGKKGEDLIILVPVGSVVFTEVAGEEMLLGNLTTAGQKVLAVKGGKGGLGNVRFVTTANQAPEAASRGEPGEERRVILELKLITDMCIIGYPNSGKSTLLSHVSQAKPEVAEYPFTTRQPMLGVIQGSRRDFIIAEIPGLVEGAHTGKGLGYEFLRHVERTKLLIYLLDGTSATLADDLDKLEQEMTRYKSDLRRKPKVVAVNKVDLPQVQTRLPDARKALSKLEVPVFYISALSGEGVLEFTKEATEMVGLANQRSEVVTQEQVAIFRPRAKK